MSLTTSERFWEKVRKTSYCWVWIASVRPVAKSKNKSCKNSYGQFWSGSSLVYAHRFAYESEIEPIAKTDKLVNKCGNELCVRPEHWRIEPKKKYARRRG